MKPKIEFDIQRVGDEIQFSQKITKTMSVGKAVTELKKMQTEKLQLQQEEKQTQAMITNRHLEEQVEQLSEQVQGLNDIEVKWKMLIEPEVEKLKKELTRDIKLSKAKEKYNKIKDKTMQIIKQNQIIAPLIEKYDLEMNHPIILELKQKFGEL